MDATAQLKAALADRYIIEREIGTGGMATVYLARDVKHNRKVALKLLRSELGAVLGTERFLSEINVTANLQHPHLLPLFDSGEVTGQLFYVMPFIEGESLRDRLDREKQLPVDEAVRITLAICSALDYAHRRNIVHRDLKPENILLHDGQPIVADFGIALAVTNAGGERVTQSGVSLGTPRYMSPEQAAGDRAIDARSDIYSLGVVLYEMLTGEPPHVANTVQAIIAKVLTDRPQHVSHMRESVPAHVDAAVMQALAKLPADRFATAGEFADTLRGQRVPTGLVAIPATDAAQRARRRRQAVLFGSVGAVVLLAATAALVVKGKPAAPAALAFELTFDNSVQPEFMGVTTTIALSGDGTRFAFAGRGPAGNGIYVRRLDELQARFIPGTERGLLPRFSPDGRSLVFEAQGNLKTTSLDGGAPSILTRGSAASWSDLNEIIYITNGVLSIVPAAGGEARQIVRSDSVNGRTFDPYVLPGGKAALVSFQKPGNTQLGQRELAVIRVSDGRIKPLGVRGFAPRYAAGQIVFVRVDGTLFRAPFSLRRERLLADPTPLASNVLIKYAGFPEFTVSDNGMLVYRTGGDLERRHLVRVDRNGGQRVLLERERIRFPRISPNGRRIALEIPQAAMSGRTDVWVFDLATQALTRMTENGGSGRPVWSYDGKRLAWVYYRGRYPLRWRNADGSGSPQTILSSDSLSFFAISFGPPGTHIVVEADTGTFAGTNDLWIAPSDSPRALRQLFGKGTQWREQMARLSPNGRLLAYQSDESGTDEIYVRALNGPGVRIQVSNAGGIEPVWSPDGRRVFYRAANHIASTEITETPALDVVRRDSLFEDRFMRTILRWSYDVFPNGDFLFMEDSPEGKGKLLGITNWPQRSATVESKR